MATDPKIVAAAEAIAVKVAKNAGVAPQLCLPHILLGLQDFVAEQASAPGELAALEGAVRAANLALFVIRKHGVMPNSSWQRGFENDLAPGRAILAGQPAPAVVAGDQHAEFEQWAASLDLDLQQVAMSGGEMVYSDCNTDYAWKAWQECARKAGAGQAIPAAEFKRVNKGGSGEMIGIDWLIPFADIPDAGLLYTAAPAAVAQEPVAVPDGWKMVPVRLTNEMRNASRHRIGFTGMYEAAIAAAPTPPTAQAGILKNAERYLVLRDKETGIQAMTGNNGQWGECGHREIYGEELDAAIDATISAAKGD